MTTLTETWRDVGLNDLAGKVVITAAGERESADGTARILPKPVTLTFSGGSFEAEGLEPGLAEVWVHIDDDGPSFGKRVTIPATGSHRLKTLATEVVDLKTVGVFTAEQLQGLLGPMVGAIGYPQLARNPDALIVGAVTRNSNGAATSAPVLWPDGTPGTYTATTLSTAFPGAVDAYKITYGAPVTKTYTQPAITRDVNGAAAIVPAIAVS